MSLGVWFGIWRQPPRRRRQKFWLTFSCCSCTGCASGWCPSGSGRSSAWWCCRARFAWARLSSWCGRLRPWLAFRSGCTTVRHVTACDHRLLRNENREKIPNEKEPCCWVSLWVRTAPRRRVLWADTTTWTSQMAASTNTDVVEAGIPPCDYYQNNPAQSWTWRARRDDCSRIDEWGPFKSLFTLASCEYRERKRAPKWGAQLTPFSPTNTNHPPALHTSTNG